ncbi:MAG: hypothetical protein NDJ90_02865 [Oligoflexia bacterium]|nr:hypothetical protein [Oligoflexia bacterium]
MTATVLFSLASLFFLLGTRALCRGLDWEAVFFPGRERAQLARVASVFQELEETFEAGLIPASERWEELRGLPAPWAGLASESLKQLRLAGGALLPTLKRLRGLAVAHQAAWSEGKARSAQAVAQSFACAVLAPVFGLVLYQLLPGVAEHRWLWIAAVLVALGLAGAGSLWLHAMAEAARWGGLMARQRPWMLAAQCGGERFLALLRAGSPPDLAWTSMLGALGTDFPDLAAAWGHSVYTLPQSSATREWERRGGALNAKSALIQAGQSIRKAIQVSLMEGRPCAERVEAVLEALRQELRACTERELALLGTRALKPLFLCVAPALLGLLAFGMALAWSTV